MPNIEKTDPPVPVGESIGIEERIKDVRSQIIQNHEKLQEAEANGINACGKAIYHAWEMGRAFIQAKEILGFGRFTDFKESFPGISARTANRWINIARHFQTLEDLNKYIDENRDRLRLHHLYQPNSPGKTRTDHKSSLERAVNAMKRAVKLLDGEADPNEWGVEEKSEFNDALEELKDLSNQKVNPRQTLRETLSLKKGKKSKSAKKGKSAG